MKKILWCGALLLANGWGFAQTTITLSPSKDNSIFSESLNSNGTGKLFSGYTCAGDFRRALLEFDIAAAVPPGSIITDVYLSLNVDNVSVGAESSIYSLHAVTTEWGEGTSYSTGGTGAAPVAPDANWPEAMFGSSSWLTAGGDFTPTASALSALTPVIGTFGWSGDAMVADAQAWLESPADNHGWILIGDEGTTCSARRFGSKDEGVAPVLEITYVCATPDAVCQNLTLYLNDAGMATISDADLDGGSTSPCGGDVSFSASQTTFTCDDIFTGEVPPSMVISAVYDVQLPGGLPKGIELYVINDIADLSAYGVGFANNGGGTDGIEFTFPAVSAVAGTYIYLASEDVLFLEWFGFEPDYVDSDAGINGDDAIELFLDGEVIDVFGDIDVDGTGTPWEYMDGWARRVSNTGPDGAVFTIENWIFSGINVLDDETTNATAAVPVPVGTYTTPATTAVAVTLTVTDEEMSTSTCVASVFVFDTLAPVMSCVGETTIVLDETGSVTLDPSDLDAGTEDGCGIASLTLSETTFTCANEGSNEVMLYATDIYGNMDSCLITVIIDGSEVITIGEGDLLNPTCFGFEDGAIDIDVSGGTPDYLFDWDNDGTGDFDDMEDLFSLAAGSYEVSVEDANGCKTTAVFELTQPEEITIDTDVENASCPSTADGAIYITVSGGTPPYFGADDMTGLLPGTQTITITDANGCFVLFDVEVGVETEIDATVTLEEGISLTANQDGATYQWVSCPDFEEIAGATEQTYTPAVGDGEEFAVIISLGGCVDTSDCVPFAFESIEEYNRLNAVVYPNPSTGLVYIQLQDAGVAVSVTLTDMKGSVVLNAQNFNPSTALDLGGLENGIYLLQIKSEAGIATKKITLNK